MKPPILKLTFANVSVMFWVFFFGGGRVAVLGFELRA
jgi:hypothetical protein